MLNRDPRTSAVQEEGTARRGNTCICPGPQSPTLNTTSCHHSSMDRGRKGKNGFHNGHCFQLHSNVKKVLTDLWLAALCNSVNMEVLSTLNYFNRGCFTQCNGWINLQWGVNISINIQIQYLSGWPWLSWQNFGWVEICGAAELITFNASFHKGIVTI